MKTKLHQISAYVIHLLKAQRRGHGVHSPFVYWLCEEVFYNQQALYEFEKLNDLRKKLQNEVTLIPVLDLGAGSQKLAAQERTIAAIARHGISTHQQAELIFRLIHALRHQTRIELGTSIGLTTLYMQAANNSGNTYTIEGNPALSKFAKNLADEHLYSGIRYLQGNFDQQLPELLAQLKQVDFLYIDGNHQYEATLRYVKAALPCVKPNSVILLDDIYWSPQMTKAWKTLCTWPEVTLSLDLYHFGLLFFREELKEKQHLSLLI